MFLAMKRVLQKQNITCTGKLELLESSRLEETII